MIVIKYLVLELQLGCDKRAEELLQLAAKDPVNNCR